MSSGWLVTSPRRWHKRPKAGNLFKCPCSALRESSSCLHLQATTMRVKGRRILRSVDFDLHLFPPAAAGPSRKMSTAAKSKAVQSSLRRKRSEARFGIPDANGSTATVTTHDRASRFRIRGHHRFAQNSRPTRSVFDKMTYWPWVDGRLHRLLSSDAIDTIVLTGGETDVCPGSGTRCDRPLVTAWSC
jgi:hypothetical protein